MQIRTVVASQSTNIINKDDNEVGTRQFILVLIGICILLYQQFSFSLKPLYQFSKSTATIAISYQNSYGHNGLYFRQNQGKSNTDLLSGLHNLPAEITTLFFKPIPINIASIDLLITIPGIGPRLAYEIHDYIIKNGEMTEVSDLKKVRGIGEQKSKKIAKYIRI